jgi:hypothetical protein
MLRRSIPPPSHRFAARSTGFCFALISASSLRSGLTAQRVQVLRNRRSSESERPFKSSGITVQVRSESPFRSLRNQRSSGFGIRIQLEREENQSDLKLFQLLEGLDDRSSAITKIVHERSSAWSMRGRTSFCSSAWRWGSDDHVLVLEFGTTAWQRQPRASLGAAPQRFDYPATLVSRILAASRDDARSPTPNWGARREGLEILRDAGKSVLFNAAKLSSEDGYSSELFHQVDLLSTLFYEGSAIHGEMSFLEGAPDDVDWQLQLVRPIPLSQARWARKFLETSSHEFRALSDGTNLLGIARANSSSLTIQFTGHHRWRLTCHGKTLMVVAMGVPTLPRRELDLALLDDATRRIFPDSEVDFKEIKRLAKLVEVSAHGTTLVVAMDAQERATRLAASASVVVPQRLSDEAFHAATRIDGATIVDPRGHCHAIGAILDGEASVNESPARGARFNSALRYVSKAGDVLALVRSDDGGVDLLPRLRPQIERSKLESLVKTLESQADGSSRVPAARQLIPYLPYLCDTERQAVLDASMSLLFEDKGLFSRIYDSHTTDVLEDA